MPACRKCKTDLAPSMKFCPECGKKVEEKARRGERADGLIEVKLDLGRDAEGRRVRRTFYGKTRKEAEAKADAFRRDVENGLDVHAEQYTVKQWGDQWLAAYKADMKFKTKETYQDALNRINKGLGNRIMSDLRQVDIKQFANSFADFSSSTIAKTRITLNQLFDRAFENGLIIRSPALGVKWPKGLKGKRRSLEEWEGDLIENNWQHQRAGFWALIMLYTGIRRGELISLEWTNVDLKKMIIRVEESAHYEGNTPVDGEVKSESSVREIPIFLPLYKALSEAKKIATSPYVCTTVSGKQLTHTSFTKGWDALLRALERAANGFSAEMRPGKRQPTIKDKEEAGSKEPWITVDFTPHELRHTFATYLYDSGVDVKTAQYFLGHADVMVTMQIYTHLSRQRKQTSIESLHAFMENGRKMVVKQNSAISENA